MDTAGAEYLNNIAELAITFSAISALLTIVRQIKGGGISATDVYLLTTFMAAGFATCMCAILPSLVTLLAVPGWLTWPVASLSAATLLGTVVTLVLRKRHQLDMQRLAPLVRFCFGAYWACVLLLAGNALLPPISGVGVHAAAVTMSLGISMLLFVRRIATLGSRGSRGEWDLR